MGSLDYSKRRGRDGRWLGELQWSKANLESVPPRLLMINAEGFIYPISTPRKSPCGNGLRWGSTVIWKPE